VIINSRVCEKIHEVRGKSRDSQAKRPLRPMEFRKTIELFRAEDDFNHKWKYHMMCLWQYHLIGRINDVVHFQMSDPRGHNQWDFALRTKV
jgi:hypothetical protein